MLRMGHINKLRIENIVDHTITFKDPNSQETIEIHQHNTSFQVGDMLDVFVYINRDGKPVASLDMPYACVGEYGFLEMLGSSQHGAYFDLGLDEDLFVPRTEQSYRLEPHDIYIIRVCIDENTGRLYGSTDQKAHLKDFPYQDIEEKHFVSLIPVERTDLGYKVIINQKYLGMIYHNEIFSEIQGSEMYQGVIKNIREDGLIDAALQKQGFSNVIEAKQAILKHLEENNGISKLTDKSTPELIRDTLGMSKKTFKNALGILYKEKKVRLSSDVTKLAN